MRRIAKKVDATGRAAVKLLFKPAYKSTKNQNKLKMSNSGSKANAKQTWTQAFMSLSWSKIEMMLFPNMPDHYPLSKKLALTKSQTFVGKMWDVLLIFMSILACAIYVSETYEAGYEAVQVYGYIEIIVTQFFAADFLYNFFAASNILRYLTDAWTLVDLVTIIPVYITIGLQASTGGGSAGVNLSIFRFVRILRLIRILRMFKLLNTLSGIQRQLVTLSLTLVSLIFMAAGVVHIMENDLKQTLFYSCSYTNAATNWAPSCYSDSPFDAATDTTCDCVSLDQNIDYTCVSTYQTGDKNGEPSGITCEVITFLDALYFLVVTVATVGYGDISPSTQLSKAVMMGFIVTSFVLIPVQVNALTELLAANSQYRQPFNQASGESHIIICGYIGDWRKIEKFFKEFFHPDRNYSAAPDFHALIMSPSEPSDDLKALMYNSHFDGRISYLIGSSLSIEDLQKARADVASAMFFFCNAETPEENATLDDAATVLRTLSVSNFNPNLDCFVQVLKPEDRDILKDSDVEMILCLDEYKTSLQARNAICPGISTLVENLFHSFSEQGVFSQANLEGHSRGAARVESWTDEYQQGLIMEPYFIPLPSRYAEMLSYEWALMVEGIYLEWDVMAIGVASAKDHSLILNPGRQETRKYKYLSRFFAKYNMLIIMAGEQGQASQIASALDDPAAIDKILNKMLVAEESFTVRKIKQKSNLNKEEKNKLIVSSLREIIRVAKSWSGLNAAQTVPGDGDDEEYTKYIAKNSGSGADAAQIARINKMKYAATSRDRSPSMDDDSDEEDSSRNNETHLKDKDALMARMRRGSSFNMARVSMATKASHQRGQVIVQHVHGFSGEKKEETCVMEAEPIGARTPGSSRSTMSPTSGLEGGGSPMSDSSPGRAGGRERTLSTGSATGLLNLDAAALRIDVQNEVDSAAALGGHIIVFGSTVNIFQFFSELRKEVHNTYRKAPPAVLVVEETPPDSWDIMCELYDNIHFLRGKMTRSPDFNRTNIQQASSVVLLAGRDSVTRVEGENLDAEALFAYLKLEKYIPRHVFFTVELTCASNMAVLNSTVLRKSRHQKSELAQELARLGDKTRSKKRMSVSQRELQRTRESVESRRLIRTDMLKGSFCSHKAVMKEEYHKFLTKSTAKVLASVPARRVSSLEATDNLSSDSKGGEGKQTNAQRLEAFWSMQDSHHLLSVFASGNAFVPGAFDSLLAQSFYTAFTPLLAETMICGSKYQSIHQIELPLPFVGRPFVDCFRAFLSRNLLVIAIYRSPLTVEGSVLPYVFTAPTAEVDFRLGDKIFLIASSDVLNENLPFLSERLVSSADGTFSLDHSIGEQLTEEKDKYADGHDNTKGGGRYESSESKDAGGGRMEKMPALAPPNGAAADKVYTSPVKAAVSEIHFASSSSSSMKPLGTSMRSEGGPDSPRSQKFDSPRSVDGDD